MVIWELMTQFGQSLGSGTLAWREPIWFWAALVPPVLWGVKRIWLRRNKQQFADARLWPWVEVNQSQSVAAASGGFGFKTGIRPGTWLTIAWLSLVVALAGPRSLQEAPEAPSRPGVDILVLMDLSRSMQATDVIPSRFLQARTLTEALAERLQPDDRLALMGFAGQAHLFSPLSFDRSLFSHALRLMEPGMLPLRGSWIERAALTGINHLEQTGGQAKLMLVFSDGAPDFWKAPELPSDLAASPAAEHLRKGETNLRTVWVGMGNTSPSVVPDTTHDSGKLHVSGRLVQSRLEEQSLQKWAQRFNGSYWRADTGPEGVARLLKVLDEVAEMEQERALPSSQAVWVDYAPLFMLLALPGIGLAFYPLRLTWRSGRSASVVVAMLCVSAGVPVSDVQAAEDKLSNVSSTAIQQEAFAAYRQEAYDLSAKLYDRVRNFEGHFGAGAAAYRAGDLESAVFYFRQAAWKAHSDALRAQALFNLANSYYLANLLPQAIASYRQALIYRTDYPKAKHNLKMALLRQQQEQVGQRDRKADKGEKGKGKGESDEGAFYGGQKPAGSDEPMGFGADDTTGISGKEKLVLPQGAEATDYRLGLSGQGVKTQSSRLLGTAGSAILDQRRRLRQAEAFEQKIGELKDEQSTLLKRLFEREAGFQAPQEAPHPIPGVQPW